MAPQPLPPLTIIEKMATQYTERTEGLHLSQITGDILVSIDPAKYGAERNDGAKWMNFMMGLMFEHVLEMAWLDKTVSVRPELIRPGEQHMGGIIGTPDAYDTLLGRPEEYKCTKKSLRQGISDRKFWIYWVQLKAYAFMLGCNSGALYVLFINGNYTYDDSDPDSGYVIKGWEDTWSDLELAENWLMLTRHAQKRGWL